MSEIQKEIDEAVDSWMELSSISGMSFQVNSNQSKGITIDELNRYLANPQRHIKQIRNASMYLSNKHGILKDVLRAMQSLPTLKYNLVWSREESNDEQRKKDDKIVQDFLSSINVKRLLRDGLYETGELGTTVTCLRNKRYVQFLDLEDMVIRKQRDGKWVVEFDLKAIDNIREMKDKIAKINSLPNEITLGKYNAYRNSSDKELFRYIELKNCHVINIDAKRNTPYGLPMTLGAWLPILQKEIIDQVERSVSSRMLSQILALTAGFIDEEKKKPAKKEVLQSWFNEVAKVVHKKESINGQKNTSGSGVVLLPHFLKLDAIKMDNTLFKEELYTKLDNEVFMNLGVSPALIYGDKGNYASAHINESKFFSYITIILEQFETMLNDYIQMILPKNVECRIILDRTTVLDKKAQIDQFKELYLQTGIASPYIESLFGGNTFHAMLEQAQYEKNVLNVGDILKPPLNAHTSSSKDLKEDSTNNDNTAQAKDDNSNQTPSPSD